VMLEQHPLTVTKRGKQISFHGGDGAQRTNGRRPLFPVT
jgi:hypothetical protein